MIPLHQRRSLNDCERQVNRDVHIGPDSGVLSSEAPEAQLHTSRRQQVTFGGCAPPFGGCRSSFALRHSLSAALTRAVYLVGNHQVHRLSFADRPAPQAA